MTLQPRCRIGSDVSNVWRCKGMRWGNATSPRSLQIPDVANPGCRGTARIGWEAATGVYRQPVPPRFALIGSFPWLFQPHSLLVCWTSASLCIARENQQLQRWLPQAECWPPWSCAPCARPLALPPNYHEQFLTNYHNLSAKKSSMLRSASPGANLSIRPPRFASPSEVCAGRPRLSTTTD